MQSFEDFPAWQRNAYGICELETLRSLSKQQLLESGKARNPPPPPFPTTPTLNPVPRPAPAVLPLLHRLFFALPHSHSQIETNFLWLVNASGSA